MAYTETALYCDSVAYAAVTMWTASTAYTVGQIVRQRTAPPAGIERCYVCILAGTSLASEPAWSANNVNVQRGAIVTEAAGPKWQEITAQPAINGDTTNVNAWRASAGTQNQGTIIKNTATTHYFIVTTAGGAGGTGVEPTWNTTAGATTTDGGLTWTCLGAVGSFTTRWAAAAKMLLNPVWNSSSWLVNANMTVYVGDDHVESSSSIYAPAFACRVLCVDHTVALPPGGNDLKTTAQILLTSGNQFWAAVSNGYIYGLQIIGSGASSPSVGANLGAARLLVEQCLFSFTNATASLRFNLGDSTSAGGIFEARSCVFNVAVSSQSVVPLGNVRLENCSLTGTWGSSSAQIFSGAGQFTNFLAEGCDFATNVASGANLVGVGAVVPLGYFQFKDCKIPPNLTNIFRGGSSTMGNLVIELTRTDSAAAPLQAWDSATATAVTLSGGNLVATNTGTTSADQGARLADAAGKTSGKYYFEMTWTTITSAIGSNSGIGVGTPTSTYIGMGSGGTTGIQHYIGGSTYSNATLLSAGSGAWSAGQVVGIAVDLDNRRFWTRAAPSGVWNGNAANNPATNVGGLTIPAGTMVPFITFGGTGGAANNVMTTNFGASAFTGAVPSGFTSGWPVSGSVGGSILRTERHTADGVLTTSTSIVRTGGADVSHAIAMTANANNYARIFNSVPLAIWNDTLASRDVTVYGIANGRIPTNAEFWIDVEYLGDVASPDGAYKRGRALPLAMAASLLSDSSTWSGINFAPTTLDGTNAIVTMSNGNLTATHSSTTGNSGVISTALMSSGQWYWEATFTTTHGSADCMAVGLTGGTFGNIVTNGTNCVVVYANGGAIWSNNANSTKSLGTIVAGDVIGMALDVDNRRAWFRKKSGGTTGNWNGDAAANPATGVGGVTVGTGATVGPFVGFGGASTTTNDQITANFGASTYAMTVPTGFMNWNGWTPFKQTITLSSPAPAQAGYLFAYPKIGRASATYYLDPKLVVT